MSTAWSASKTGINFLIEPGTSFGKGGKDLVMIISSKGGGIKSLQGFGLLLGGVLESSLAVALSLSKISSRVRCICPGKKDLLQKSK